MGKRAAIKNRNEESLRELAANSTNSQRTRHIAMFSLSHRSPNLF